MKQKQDARKGTPRELFLEVKNESRKFLNQKRDINLTEIPQKVEKETQRWKAERTLHEKENRKLPVNNSLY